MKTFKFKIATPDIFFNKTISVQAPDAVTASEWAKTLFAHHVKWWLVSFSSSYQVFNDLRKLTQLTGMPQIGIADNEGNVVWPDGELRDSFTCEDGKFTLKLLKR